MVAIVALSGAALVIVPRLLPDKSRELTVSQVTSAAPVRCIEVRQEVHLVAETFYGFIEPVMEVKAAFEIGGRIVRLGGNNNSLVEGARIQAGDDIASLSSERYDLLVGQAQARLQLAEAERDAFKARLDSAQASFDDAVSECSQMRDLFARDAASRRELERCELAVAMAKSQLEQLSRQLESAVALCEAAHAELALARADRRDVVLKSPISGQVSKIHARVGEMVAPATPIMTIVDADTVKLVVGVPERKLSMLQCGQAVRINVNALEQRRPRTQAQPDSCEREGTISLIPAASDATTGLFNVEVILDNLSGELRPGMTASATVIVDKQPGIAIPPDAVIDVGYAAWFFCINDDEQLADDKNHELATASALRVRRVPIPPQENCDDGYVVPARPGEGLRLVVQGQTNLIDGQLVRLLGAEDGTLGGRLAAESRAPER